VAYLTRYQDAANSYRTEFVGHNGDPDSLWFASKSHQRLYRDSRESDMNEVSVWVDDAPSDQGPGDVLLHREAPRIDQYPDEGGRVLPLAFHVESFDLRFLDSRNAEWIDEWDSRSGDQGRTLPRAVRIGLVLIAPDPEDPERRTIDKPFLTTVMLDRSRPLQPLGVGGE